MVHNNTHLPLFQKHNPASQPLSTLKGNISVKDNDKSKCDLHCNQKVHREKVDLPNLRKSNIKPEENK